MSKINQEKLQERANQFRRDFLHTDKGSFARSLAPYAKYLPLLVRSQDSLPFSGHLLIGLTAAMEGAIEGEGPYWLFSKDFKRLADEVAEGVISKGEASGREASGASEIDRELLSKVMMGSLAALSGLLSLVFEQPAQRANEESLEEKEAPPSNLFYKGLLLRSLLSSELLVTYLRQVAQSMGVEERDLPWISEALESLALLWAGLTLSSDDQDELLETISLKLADRFEKLEVKLQELTSTGRITKEKGQALRLFVGQGHKTLSSGDFKQFYKGLEEVGSPYGFQLSKLQDDINSAKRLFKVLDTGFKASSQNKENAILIIG